MTVSKSCWSELLSRSSSGSDAMRLFLGRWWRGQVTMRCTHVSGVGSQCGQDVEPPGDSLCSGCN